MEDIIGHTEHVSKMGFILNSDEEISETDDEVPETLNMTSSTHRSQHIKVHLSCTASDVAAALKACRHDRLWKGPEPNRKHMDQSEIKTDQCFWEELLVEFTSGRVTNRAYPEKCHCFVRELPTVRRGCSAAPYLIRAC